jgi:sporulation protein YlmC with PRC-barrel domain
MRLGKDLIGKLIISITDGRSLGSVKDIYVNNDLRWITAVFTGHEGLIKRKLFLIPRDSVSVFGIDAILVKHNDVIVEEQEQPEVENWTRLSKLRGREVNTPGGTKVGSVGDIIIGEHGEITGFALSQVRVEGPIQQHGTIPRLALIDTGNEETVMTIDITKAEMTPPGSEPAPQPVPSPVEKIKEEVQTSNDEEDSNNVDQHE